VSNKKHKHALAASDKRAIRFCSLLCHQSTFSLWPLSPRSHSSPQLPTLTHVVLFPPFLTIYKTGIPHSPAPVTLSAVSSLSYTLFLPLYPNIIPWISRPRKQILFSPPRALLRSHSTVLDHCGELSCSSSTRLVLCRHSLLLPGLFQSQ